MPACATRLVRSPPFPHTSPSFPHLSLFHPPLVPDMKISGSKDRRKQARHTPLAKQIEQDSAIKKRKRVGKLAQEKDDITEEVCVNKMDE